MASILERSRLPRLPVHPAANSGPNEVSAVKECLVPRLDSKMNPGRSSRKIVACYRGKGTACTKNDFTFRQKYIYIKPSFKNTTIPGATKVGE